MRRRCSLGRRAAGLILAATLGYLGAGCWDRAEIGDRLYALCLVADRPAGKPDGTSGAKPQQYRIAVEVGLWKQMRGSPASGGGAGGGGGGGKGGGLTPEKPAWVMAATADSVAKTLDHLRKRSYRPVSLSHLKVVVFGEELARKGIAGALDFLERDREVQRRVEVVVTPGPGLNILQSAPPEDQLVAVVLPQLLGETRSSPHSIDSSVGAVVTGHHAKACYLMPRARYTDNDGLVVGGAALFKKDRLLGWIGEEECAGVNWITGRVKEAVLQYRPRGGGPEEFQVMRVTAGRRRLKLTVSQGRPLFRLSVSATGSLQESPYPITSNEAVARTERDAAAAIRADIQKAWTAQRRLRADVCGFGAMVREEAPDLWDRVGDRWDDYFATEARLEVTAKVGLRHTGEIR